MEYAFVAVAAAPVRRKPGHRREMVSQLLFGEAVELERMKGNLWVRVKSLHDNYRGWMTLNMLEPADPEKAGTLCEYVTTDLISTIIINEKKLNIPVGSSLPGFEKGRGELGKLSYTMENKTIRRHDQQAGEDLLNQYVMPWLNTPYMWGGRTPLGVDCSGFVQLNYKMMGIDLPRDAWQQAQEGKQVKKLREGQAGDLVFFDDRDEIVHVGILLSNEKIIHASGRVRIDSIDKKGIINSDTGKRTHRLEIIRRMW